MKECCNTLEEIKTLFARSFWTGADSVYGKDFFLSRLQSSRLVKQNPKRKVFLLGCTDGAGEQFFYLKLFTDPPFPKNLFRCYGKEEFEIAGKLEAFSVPVVEYVAWGRFPSGTFCISKALPGAVDCRRYFFESVCGDPEREKKFVRLLADLIRPMNEKGFVHPDFHLGNILYSRESGTLFLVDPYGIHKRCLVRGRIPDMNFYPLMELLSDPLREELFHAVASAAGQEENREAAEKYFQRALSCYKSVRKRVRDASVKRVLSGSSKFATGITLPNGNKCFFRHTYWYEVPEVLALDPAWRKVVCNRTAAEKIWVDSFFSPVRLTEEELPLAWELLPGGEESTVLYYGK